MQITLESTNRVVQVNGWPARLWEGHTESGIPCHAFITRLGVDNDADQAEFQRDLQECRPMSPALAELYPVDMRLVT